jgi:predicted nucleic acid-binding protein
MRAFIDASVLFAAAYSSTGASREIIRYALRGQVTLIISEFVLEEAERNLASKVPAAVDIFRQLIQAIPFEVSEPTAEEVRQAEAYTAHKDAPVIAAARRAQTGYLVSLDRRHLVGLPELAARSGLQIVLPEQFLQALRQAEAH